MEGKTIRQIVKKLHNRPLTLLTGHKWSWATLLNIVNSFSCRLMRIE